MVTINLNLNNFSEQPILSEVFGSFDNNDEYTEEGVFHREALHSVLDVTVPWFIMSNIFRGFSKNMKQEKVSHEKNVLIVRYEEQHPKKGRCQKYRLTFRTYALEV